MYKTENLFDTSKTLATRYFEESAPHLIVPKIREIIREIGASLSPREYEKHGECIYISRCACIDRSAFIGEGVIIGHNATIRHGAYIRGDALIGEGTVIGNSSEVKSSILFDGCQLPHFNYVGDSIIGYKAHFGAGAIASNLRLDGKGVRLHLENEIIDTGARKLGALVGDNAEIGCNSVLCPGTIIERGSRVYPLSLVGGYVKGIYKER